MSQAKFLRAQSDAFVGQRRRLDRYLICSLQGYFPVLVKTGPGRGLGLGALAVIYRTGGTHVSATGTLAVATSRDGGKSWTDGVEIAPRWSDVRNPAFGVNARGQLIAAFWKACMDSYADSDNGPRWDKFRPGKGPSTFITRSSDRGQTWSTPQPYKSKLLKLASPYGRIITGPDGTMYMGVYAVPGHSIKGVRDISVLARSRDGGRTWGEETLVAREYNETAFAFLPDGRLLAAARSESGHLATLFSDDGGHKWSDPVQVTHEGEHPADLTVLPSPGGGGGGKVLMTFGRRIRPMGCGALLSHDGGKTWDKGHEVLLAGDGIRNVDLGYPSTVRLNNGTFVTALYYASGSETSSDFGNWGDVSCQAIHYRIEDVTP